MSVEVSRPSTPPCEKSSDVPDLARVATSTLTRKRIALGCGLGVIAVLRYRAEDDRAEASRVGRATTPAGIQLYGKPPDSADHRMSMGIGAAAAAILIASAWKGRTNRS